MTPVRLKEAYLALLIKTLTASVYVESGWNRFYNHKSMIVKFVIWFFDKFNISLVKRNSFNFSYRNEGTDWPMFGFTMTGIKRMTFLKNAIINVIEKKIPGDLFEAGVWRGGSSILMKAVLDLYDDDRRVILADSFEGMPKPKGILDGFDLSDNKYLAVSLDEVKANFDKFELLDEKIVFIKGWFCDSLPLINKTSISILRLDGDLYSSTMDVLVNLYDLVSVGGYIIIDDYHSWPQCKKAVHDFFYSRHIDISLIDIDQDSAYLIKK